MQSGEKVAAARSGDAPTAPTLWRIRLVLPDVEPGRWSYIERADLLPQNRADWEVEPLYAAPVAARSDEDAKAADDTRLTQKEACALLRLGVKPEYASDAFSGADFGRAIQKLRRLAASSSGEPTAVPMSDGDDLPAASALANLIRRSARFVLDSKGNALPNDKLATMIAVSVCTKPDLADAIQQTFEDGIPASTETPSTAVPTRSDDEANAAPTLAQMQEALREAASAENAYCYIAAKLPELFGGAPSQGPTTWLCDVCGEPVLPPERDWSGATLTAGVGILICVECYIGNHATPATPPDPRAE